MSLQNDQPTDYEVAEFSDEDLEESTENSFFDAKMNSYYNELDKLTKDELFQLSQSIITKD